MILFRYLENIVKKTSDHFSLFKGKTEREERGKVRVEGARENKPSSKLVGW